MNDLTPIATVVLAIALLCAPPAGIYLLVTSEKDDDPRPRGRADR
jgi:hypothetical protein